MLLIRFKICSFIVDLQNTARKQLIACQNNKQKQTQKRDLPKMLMINTK